MKPRNKPWKRCCLTELVPRVIASVRPTARQEDNGGGRCEYQYVNFFLGLHSKILSVASIGQPKYIGAVYRDLSPGLQGGTKVWAEVTHKIRLSDQIHTHQRCCLVLDFPGDFKDTNNQETQFKQENVWHIQEHSTCPSLLMKYMGSFWFMKHLFIPQIVTYLYDIFKEIMPHKSIYPRFISHKQL